MSTKIFPVSRCYVCSKIIKEKNGLIAAGNFVDYLDRMSKRFDYIKKARPKLLNFINSLSREYFEQFPEDFFKVSEEVETPLEDIVFSFVDNSSYPSEEIISRILEKKPEKYLFMLSHYKCLSPSLKYGPSLYKIELGDINSCEKAIDWTIHLGKKKWFNHFGWIKILKDLFTYY